MFSSPVPPAKVKMILACLILPLILPLGTSFLGVHAVCGPVEVGCLAGAYKCPTLCFGGPALCFGAYKFPICGFLRLGRDIYDLNARPDAEDHLFTGRRLGVPIYVGRDGSGCFVDHDFSRISRRIKLKR